MGARGGHFAWRHPGFWKGGGVCSGLGWMGRACTWGGGGREKGTPGSWAAVTAAGGTQ